MKFLILMFLTCLYACQASSDAADVTLGENTCIETYPEEYCACKTNDGHELDLLCECCFLVFDTQYTEADKEAYQNYCLQQYGPEMPCPNTL